jgi:hypothetical protein
VNCTLLERYHPVVSVAALLLGIQSLFQEPDRDIAAYDSLGEEWTIRRVLECRRSKQAAPEEFISRPEKGGKPIEIPYYAVAFSPISWTEIHPDEFDLSLGLLVKSSEKHLFE